MGHLANINVDQKEGTCGYEPFHRGVLCQIFLGAWRPLKESPPVVVEEVFFGMVGSRAHK